MAKPKPNPRDRTTPAGKSKKSVTGSASNEPHVPGAGKPARTRSGAACKECIRVQRRDPKRKCWKHGGRSSGPKSVEGKGEARQNAVKHGLRSSPARYRADMSDDLRLRYEELVATIAEAEGVSKSPLDLAIVRDFVLVEMMLEGGRVWLFRRGFLTVEGWRSVKLTMEGGGGALVPETDVGGEQIPEPVVPESLVGYVNTLSRLKAKLHERLRSGTGKIGDPGRLSVAEESRRRLQDLFPDDDEGPSA